MLEFLYHPEAADCSQDIAPPVVNINRSSYHQQINLNVNPSYESDSEIDHNQQGTKN